MTAKTSWRSGLGALLPAIGLTLAVGLIVLGSTLTPASTGQMAVVFPPFTDELTAWAIVRDAGGLIVAPTTMSNIVVAYAVDAGFQGRVRSHGALFFLAAGGLCSPALPSETRA